MQSHAPQQITAAELIHILREHTQSQAKFQLADVLKISGYSAHLINIDFTAMPADLMQFVSLYADFSGIECFACTFDAAHTLQQGKPEKLKNCVIFSSSQEQHDFSELCSVPKDGNVVINHHNPKPVVGIVYCQDEGTRFANMFIPELEKRGMNIVLLTKNRPSCYTAEDNTFMPQHAIFAREYLFDGIILSGGKNIIQDPSQYTTREKLERYLTNLCLDSKIPAFAICRGHQFIGHFFGAEVRDIDSNHEKDVMLVESCVDSMLYQLAQKKFDSQCTRKKESNDVEKTHESFCYTSKCVHKQGVFFTNGMHPKITITVKSKEGLIEGMQVADLIFTLQHHSETCLDKSSMARAIFKLFAHRASSHHQNTRALSPVKQSRYL